MQKMQEETELPQTLFDFLSTKELFYKDIDYDYFPLFWKRVEREFSVPKVIHIIGTNGKGSTGRFLAYELYKKGFKVGHYSSPHILKFNERVWLNGSDASDNILQSAHESLLKKIDSEDLNKLSYFEYTTILAIEVFKNVDYIVLEAGLGGEYDATSVFESLFTLVTPIDIDHESFLGDNLINIALTKLKSVKKFAILAKQKNEVYKVTDDLKLSYFKSSELFSKKELSDIKDFIKKRGFASYLSENLTLAMAGVRKLGLTYELELLKDIVLNGRFQKIKENITIDVGHNLLAAKVIKKELGSKKVVLIYNSYKDKNYFEVLKSLKENIKEVMIIEVKNERMVKKSDLEKALKELGISFSTFKIDKLDANSEYLVFGSFVVVERFLGLLWM